jgi:hypothetical protein
MPTRKRRNPLLAAALLASLVSLSLPAHARADASGRPADAAADSVAAAAPAPVPEPPLLLDPADMGFGVSMYYRRIPNSADIAALAYYDNVQHLVLSLPAWPEDFAAIEPLARVLLPQGTDVIVLLPGYPPTRSQASLWNMLRLPLRIVLSVDGPPVDRGMILELNAMRGLERVIATMEHPSRSGFERLQRPLGFRVLLP